MDRSDSEARLHSDSDDAAGSDPTGSFSYSDAETPEIEPKTDSSLNKLVATIAPYRPANVRDVMRAQFFTSLEVERLFGAYPDDNDRRRAVNDALDNVLQNRTSWRSAYCSEQLMVGLMDDDKLIIETERRIGTAERIKISAAPLYSEEFGKMKADNFSDPNRLRHLLLRIISDSQWRRMRDYLERRFATAYVSRINRIWMASIVIFLFSLLITDMLPDRSVKAPAEIATATKSGTPSKASLPDTAPSGPAPPGAAPSGPAPISGQFVSKDVERAPPPKPGNPQLHKLAGLLVALIMGLLGAAFSMVWMAQKRIQSFALEDIQLQSRWEFLLLRLGFGTGAAVVLYFGFQAGVIHGKLFPQIELLGFTENRPAIGERRLGSWVPNSDFASLLVWSFLAGFSENFVPNFLRRAEATELDYKP